MKRRHIKGESGVGVVVMVVVVVSGGGGGGGDIGTLFWQVKYRRRMQKKVKVML